MYSLLWILVISIIVSAFAASPRNVIASIRGKRYKIQALTVDEFSRKVESLVGLKVADQNILFRGKALKTSDNFEDLGIENGSILNVLKGRKLSTSHHMPKASVKPTKNQSKETPGDVFSGINREDMKQTMAQLDAIMDSGFLEELFADEEKLENARQQLLLNIDKYDSMIPGFRSNYEKIASDPVLWKETMHEAMNQMMKFRKQYQTADNKTRYSCNMCTNQLLLVLFCNDCFYFQKVKRTPLKFWTILKRWIMPMTRISKTR
jgi:hypothetical protein